MPLGQAEPALQIEVVVDLIEGVPASKEAGAEAPHQPGHLSRGSDRCRRPGERGSRRSRTDAGPMSSLPGPGSRPPPGSSRRGAGSSPVGVSPGPVPCRCRRPTGSVASPRTPFFRVQVPLDRLPDLVQRVGHPQPGRVEWTALVVVENAANRGTVVQDHVARRIILGMGGGSSWRRPRSRSIGLRGGGGCPGSSHADGSGRTARSPSSRGPSYASEPWHDCRLRGPAWPGRGGNGWSQ